MGESTRKVRRSCASSRARSAIDAAALPVLVLLVLAVAPPADAAWVRGEVRLNLRSGPGNEYRILGTLQTGDEIVVLNRGERWTKVRTSEGEEGFIPGGYLSDEPPPSVRLAELEARVEDLTKRLSATEKEATTLRSENTALATSDEAQKREIERLTRENFELRAGARWPEWITGALILSTGMALGAILRSLAGRGKRQRIKL